MMKAQDESRRSTAFQGMVALVLDSSLLTSQFRLCDTIAEYFADIVAQTHDDPARYANFSSLVINEILELAFRSARLTGEVAIDIFRSEDCVRLTVTFMHEEDDHVSWSTKYSSASPNRHPAYDLFVLADAIGVDLHVEASTPDRIMLIADFSLEDVH